VIALVHATLSDIQLYIFLKVDHKHKELPFACIIIQI
jgi:hypothetical protein